MSRGARNGDAREEGAWKDIRIFWRGPASAPATARAHAFRGSGRECPEKRSKINLHLVGRPGNTIADQLALGRAAESAPCLALWRASGSDPPCIVDLNPDSYGASRAGALTWLTAPTPIGTGARPSGGDSDRLPERGHPPEPPDKPVGTADGQGRQRLETSRPDPFGTPSSSGALDYLPEQPHLANPPDQPVRSLEGWGRQTQISDS